MAILQPASGSIATSRRPAVPEGRPVVGITFEGGGALGLAHVGVMLWLQQNHVPVDRISGTSMGALVGALFAAGKKPAEIEALARSDAFSTLFTTQPLLSHASIRRREDRQDLPHALTLGLKGGGLSEGNNLIADDQLTALLRGQLSGYNTSVLNFDDLPIPFRCVASNLTTLAPYTFSRGSLPFAVRASISIPGVFSPVSTQEGILVDGAITDNLPTDVMRRDLQPDVVISVYLGDGSFSEKDASSLTSVVERALSAGTARNVSITRSLATIEIAPAVTAYSVTDYGKAEVLIKAGFDATEAMRKDLLPYALNQSDWETYEADLNSRKRPSPGRIEQVRVEGPDSRTSARIARDARQLQDLPFSSDEANDIVANIHGEGAMEATYETFRTPPTVKVSDQAKPVSLSPDNGLLIRWRPNSDGPPYLLVNTDVAAMNGNVSSAILAMRFVDENLGGYGSELRTDAEVGYLTRLNAEYYVPLGASPFYVKPQLRYLKRPVYYWERQKRVSERLLQQAGGGLEVGATLGRSFQAAIQYQNLTERWVLEEGSDESPTPHLSGTTQSVAARIFFTNRTAEIAAPAGSEFDLSVGHLLHTAQSPEAPFAILKAKHSFPLAKSDSLIVSLNANTYFRNNVADPFRFTLGGPLKLSGSSVDEYRGTDTAFIQSIYLRRIANLPTGLGQGIYLAGGYEGGSIWSPERNSILRQDGVAGILLNTPLGVITLGSAIGDARHRKVFFTLGRFF